MGRTAIGSRVARGGWRLRSFFCVVPFTCIYTGARVYLSSRDRMDKIATGVPITFVDPRSGVVESLPLLSHLLRKVSYLVSSIAVLPSTIVNADLSRRSASAKAARKGDTHLLPVNHDRATLRDPQFLRAPNGLAEEMPAFGSSDAGVSFGVPICAGAVSELASREREQHTSSDDRGTLLRDLVVSNPSRGSVVHALNKLHRRNQREFGRGRASDLTFHQSLQGASLPSFVQCFLAQSCWTFPVHSDSPCMQWTPYRSVSFRLRGRRFRTRTRR